MAESGTAGTQQPESRCESVHFDSVLQCEERAGHSLSWRLHIATDHTLIPPHTYIWRDEDEIDNGELEGAYAIAEVLERNRSAGV